MMTGLGYLMFFGYYLKKKKHGGNPPNLVSKIPGSEISAHDDASGDDYFDIFNYELFFAR